MHMHCAACYKGHHVTLVLHPQRDIDREKGREGGREGEREREREREREGERERERERERGRERAGSSVVSIETLYCKTRY